MAHLKDTFVALDLEYNQPSRTIIQVGVSIGSSGQSEAEFLTRKWYLSTEERIHPDIVKLTGITDDDIRDQGVGSQQCAAELSHLLQTKDVFVNPVTWGGGDSNDLVDRFQRDGAPFPHFGRRWIDVKTFATYLSMSHPSGSRSTSGGLSSIMGRYKLQFKGQPHRADADAFNTLRLFFKLLERQKALEQAAALMRSATN